MKFLISIFISLLFLSSLQAQVGGENLSPAQMQQVAQAVERARAEIKAKGLSEAEVKKRMKEKGVDLDNIDPATADPTQIEVVFQEVVAELESENSDGETSEEPTAESTVGAESQTAKVVEDVIEDSSLDTEDIEDRVKEGQSLGEAVAEELVEKTEQENLPAVIYGHQIFRDGIVAGSTLSYDVKPPETYRLGVGDQIAITIFGQAVFTGKYIVESDGFIRPERLRPVYLKGISLKRARTLITSAFQQAYRFNSNQIEINLDIARTINIGIVGEVMKPTNYTVPATNNAVNALSIAGGPTDIGSVRKIELIKSDGTRKVLDLYEYLLNPSISTEYYLEQEDYILVPVSEKVVTISGSIRRPFRYELLENENLNKLIEYAAGLEADAYISNIQVRRIENEEERIIDVNLKELRSNSEDFELRNADVVTIRSVPKPFENFVSIIGETALEYPGQYELTEGMRISDLVAKGKLMKEAKTDVIFLQRKETDGTLNYEQINLDEILENPSSNENILLQAEDIVRINPKSLYADFGTVEITGAVKSPVEFNFSFNDRMTISDAIMIAGGLQTQASQYAYLVRKDPENLELSTTQPINVKAILESPDSPIDLALRPFDRIEIFYNPTFTDQYTVRVEGEVRQEGEYAYSENLKLKDVLRQAGGLKMEAASNKVEIFRLQINENEPTQTVVAEVEVDRDLNLSDEDIELQPFDIIVVRRIPDFENIQTVTLLGEVKFPGAHALIDENERIKSIIDRSGGVTLEAFLEGATLYRRQDSIGYVVFDFEDAINNKSSRNNLILKPGDIIEIPKQEDLVAIRGATKAPELLPDKYLADGTIDVIFHEGKRAKFYIDEYAGGISDNGKRNKIAVEQPNGKLSRTVDLGLFKIYPKVQKGAVITVGSKPPRQIEDEQEPIEKEPINWGEIVSTTIAQISAVFTLILLIERTGN